MAKSEAVKINGRQTERFDDWEKRMQQLFYLLAHPLADKLFSLLANKNRLHVDPLWQTGHIVACRGHSVGIVFN